MKCSFLGKELKCDISTFDELFDSLKNEEDFKASFLDGEGKIKWNTLFVKNDEVLTNEEIEKEHFQSEDELLIMLQLSGG
jgi:sulfur carrier protein ThiS